MPFEMKIKICMGPGCKAWDSDKMVNKLRQMQVVGEVCIVPCMNKCGGGCSIRLKDRGKVIKLKEERALRILLNSKKANLAQVG